MGLQVEVRCPLCGGAELAPLGQAVLVSRGPAGVKDSPAGRTYGCLRCGGSLAVTRTEVFSPNRALQVREPVPVAERPKARQTRNGDADMAFSPEQMR